MIIHEGDEVVAAQTIGAYIAALNADVFTAKGQHHSIRDATPDKIRKYQTVISDWIKQIE